jgi:hypothetical protein
MTFGISASAAFMGGASLLGAGVSYLGSQNAANAQKDAAAQSAAVQQQMADKSIAAQREMFDIGRTDLQPYREGGVTAQNQLMQLFGLGGDTTGANYGKYTQDFTMPEFTGDPGYQFRLKSGMDTLNRSAAARGMGVSGANIKGATEYGQNFGSNEYNNAYNRAINTFQTNRSNQLDPLYKLYIGGQASAANSAAAASNLGSNLGSTYSNLGTNLGTAATNAGAATAGGYVAGGNAINSTIGNLGNQYMGMADRANNTSYQNNLLTALNSRGMDSVGQSLLNNPFGTGT